MSNERIEELKEALAINTDDLITDCSHQAQLIMEITDIRADLALKAKQAKMIYDETCSTAEQQIRDNPDTFGISKITESAVKAAVVIHGDVHNTREQMLFADHKVDKVSAVVDGYHHRRSMLENETKLVLSGIYGEVPNGQQESGNFTRRGRNE